VDHSTTTAEAAGHSGGKHGRGGDILYRVGNPAVSRRGGRTEQTLFSQHSPQIIRDAPGEGNLLLFNNGRAPDRQWSTVEEHKLPEKLGIHEPGPLPAAQPVWEFGPSQGKSGSFYCTHISACQRLPNGNTLICQGPLAIVIEVTPKGEEVWRYVSPVCSTESMVIFARQGGQRIAPAGCSFSLFRATKYGREFEGFKGRALEPQRYLEA